MLLILRTNTLILNTTVNNYENEATEEYLRNRN